MNLRSPLHRLSVSRQAIMVAAASAMLLGATAAARAQPNAATQPAKFAGSWPAAAIAVIDIVVVTVLVAHGVEVRLVLLLAALPLFAATGSLPSMLRKMAGELTNAGTVVPICAAMGFAYVLRLTECDTHLVRLLVRPLGYARPLLVPGGILSGYLVNTTIVSQAATAAVLGPILVPLLRASGLAAAPAGAILLLGSSMGGELFNPGAVEMRKLAELTRLTGKQVLVRSAGLNLLACTTAAAVFWLQFALGDRRGRAGRPDGGHDDGPSPDANANVHYLKALVPALPLLLLALDAFVGPTPLSRHLDGPGRILAAMLVGVVAAGLASPKVIGRLAAAFFDGAGYGYAHIISLIVAASTFAAAIERSGLIKLATSALLPWPKAALAVAAVAPWRWR